MRILRIKNYEKYQSHKIKNPEWIKLYRSLLTDREFLRLDVKCRYLFVCCLILASETFNRCVNDVAYLSQRCFTDVSQDDVSRLIRSGLIVASRSTKWRSEKRQRREETETETEKSIVSLVSDPPKRASLFPEEFEPDDRAKALALSYGLNVFKEAAACKDHHRAKGTVFRTWLRNSVKFAKRG
jgi:hypothetical protein